ncbi:MAG: hypothetical protein Q7T20_02090 [Saprospiraceae bacterium]|nr:hypothetical protein [Saprospiraceae bacterium]
MVAQSSGNSAVGQLIREAEQLRPGEFEQFVVRILALNASRKSNGLSSEESLLLKNINKEFVSKKLERFLLLDEKRNQGILSTKEHSELLALVQQLEKYDAQKLQWIGQLALLRKVPFDSLLKELGLYPPRNV